MADDIDAGRHSQRTPGHGRYSHLEREQRWLLSSVPDAAVAAAKIEDRYVSGTRLRLRRVESADGVVYKLAQKVRVDPASVELVSLTNIYLDQEEFDVLAALPARVLSKSRWKLVHAGRTFTIDEFGGGLAGLVLAEMELDETEPRIDRPPFAVLDVTDDDRYSGGRLATAAPS